MDKFWCSSSQTATKGIPSKENFCYPQSTLKLWGYWCQHQPAKIWRKFSFRLFTVSQSSLSQLALRCRLTALPSAHAPPWPLWPCWSSTPGLTCCSSSSGVWAVPLGSTSGNTWRTFSHSLMCICNAETSMVSADLLQVKAPLSLACDSGGQIPCLWSAGLKVLEYPHNR